MTISPARTNLRIVLVLAALAVVALSATGSAQAAATTFATCTSQFTVTITPGFSLTPSAGTITSHGETGTVVCTGTIDGQRVTGPGTIGIDETYARGDCLSHVGVGTATITVPTTAGPKHLAGAATSRRTGVALSAEVEFPGAQFSGIGLAAPLQGRCLLTPMRQALLTVTGTLTAT
jgi:membrane protein implicated in regulation of membrane protease activity